MPTHAPSSGFGLDGMIPLLALLPVLLTIIVIALQAPNLRTRADEAVEMLRSHFYGPVPLSAEAQAAADAANGSDENVVDGVDLSLFDAFPAAD